MNKLGIYKIINILNNKIYIGYSINIYRRWEDHKRLLKKNTHHSIKLQNAYNKYGVNSFVFEIIEECDKKYIVKREQYYIDLFDSYNNGYNCLPKARSTFGRILTNETRIKMSLAQIGKKLTEEQKIKIGISNKGKKHSKESKIKMSLSKKGYKVSDEAKKKMSKAKKGTKQSFKTKEKRNKKLRGRIVLADTKIKIGLANGGRNSSRYNPTPVLQYDLNNNFIKEWRDLMTLKENGFNADDISKVCRGHRKTRYGFIWKFKL